MINIVQNNLRTIFKILKADLQQCTKQVARLAFWVK